MVDIICKMGKLAEEILKIFNEYELIITVKNGKTNVIEHGNVVKGVKRIEFTDAIDEVPEIIIQKGVI